MHDMPRAALHRKPGWSVQPVFCNVGLWRTAVYHTALWIRVAR